MLILRAEKISKSYGDQAVFEDFSFELAVGETVGLVGPSGCGKSTCARILAGLERPQSGTVEFRGKDITGMSRPEYGKFRRSVQMIFQDPAGSFNPVRTIGQSMSAVLTLTGVSRADHATVLAGALQQAGLQQESCRGIPIRSPAGRRRGGDCAGLLLSPSVMIWTNDECAGRLGAGADSASVKRGSAGAGDFVCLHLARRGGRIVHGGSGCAVVRGRPCSSDPAPSGGQGKKLLPESFRIPGERAHIHQRKRTLRQHPHAVAHRLHHLGIVRYEDNCRVVLRWRSFISEAPAPAPTCPASTSVRRQQSASGRASRSSPSSPAGSRRRRAG